MAIDKTLDLIEQVGPVPGFYLDKAHTRKWWKTEQSVRKSADTITYPEWKKNGKKSCLDYAKERMEEILANHKVVPLPEDVDKEIENILDKTRRYYSERGLL